MLKRVLAFSIFTMLALGVVAFAMSAAPVEAQAVAPYPEIEPLYVNGTYITGSCTQNGAAFNFGMVGLEPLTKYTLQFSIFEAQLMDQQTSGKLTNRMANNARAFINSLTGNTVTFSTYGGDLMAIRSVNQSTTATPGTQYTMRIGQFPLPNDDAGLYDWTNGVYTQVAAAPAAPRTAGTTIMPYSQYWIGTDAAAQTPVVVTSNVNTQPPTWDVVLAMAVWPKGGAAASTSYTAYGVDCSPAGPAGRVQITAIWTGNAIP